MDFTILVNKDNLLEWDYVPEDLVDINEPTGSKLDKTYQNKLNKVAYIFFKLMQQAAKEEKGYEIFIDSSYRTYGYQKRVFDSIVAEKGIEHAQKYCASRRNGQMIEESSEEDPELIWMKENAYRFGYILRYPKGKEEITGFNYERWHYRFVGPEVALEMREKEITTLEEYHEYRKQHSTGLKY